MHSLGVGYAGHGMADQKSCGVPDQGTVRDHDQITRVTGDEVADTRPAAFGE